MPAPPPSEHRRFILTLSELQNAIPFFPAKESSEEIEAIHKSSYFGPNFLFTNMLLKM